MGSIKTTALRLPLRRQVITPSHPLSTSKLRLPKPLHLLLVKLRLNAASGRSLLPCLCNKPEDIFCPISQEKQDGLTVAPFLRRWDVLWKWHSILSTILGCVFCHFVSPILLFLILHRHLQVHDLGSNVITGCFLAIYSIEVAATLGMIYILSASYPLSDDFFCIEPFDTWKGWLLWAGVGAIGMVIGHFVTNVVLSMFGYSTPLKKHDYLLPLIGYSKISTSCMLATVGVLAPLFEETTFRGFLMVTMTKWVSTPTAILISATIFALAHYPSSSLPQHFVSGIVLGCSYAQTRNLLTPITMHALWNSGIILILALLKECKMNTNKAHDRLAPIRAKLCFELIGLFEPLGTTTDSRFFLPLRDDAVQLNAPLATN